jgi:hypothetical protein
MKKDPAIACCRCDCCMLFMKGKIDGMAGTKHETSI